MDGSWSRTFEQHQQWWIAPGVSAILLFVVFFILSRIRWFQTRSLATCIVLSVFAHVILFSTLFLIRLFDTPPTPGFDSISVTLADLAPPSHNTESPPLMKPTAEKPWEQVPEPAAAQLPEPDPIPAEEAEWPPLIESPPTADTPPLDEFPAPSDPQPIVAENVELPPLQETNTDAPATDLPPLAATEMTGTAIEEPKQPTSEDGNSAETIELPNTDDSSTVASSSDDLIPVEARDGSTTPTAEPPVDGEWQPAVTTVKTNAPAVQPVRTDASPLPRRYAMRVAPDRTQQARARGATGETEAAVRQALEWLAKSQHPAGRWDASSYAAGQGELIDGQVRGQAGIEADTGITGLALLSFTGDGQTHISGEHKVVLQRGLEFLMRSQQADGCLSGQATYYARMYCHGIATLALADAYAMTKDARLRPFVQRALNYTLRTQNPRTGGWRYRTGESGDMSQFGWQLMALASGEQAGIPIPAENRRLLDHFVRSVSRGSYGGLACYRPGAGISRTMTAEALACRAFFNPQLSPDLIDEATRYITRTSPTSERMNLYACYYISLALSQLDHSSWPAWNNAMQVRLLKSQRSFGSAAGSWDPNTVWGAHGGRVYSTALAALCLEVYYRYTPDAPDMARR